MTILSCGYRAIVSNGLWLQSIRALMSYGGRSPLAIMIADWKLPMGVHTMQVSGQHVYQSMPKLTSAPEAATQLTSITVKMTTYFLLCIKHNEQSSPTMSSFKLS